MVLANQTVFAFVVVMMQMVILKNDGGLTCNVCQDNYYPPTEDNACTKLIARYTTWCE